MMVNFPLALHLPVPPVPVAAVDLSPSPVFVLSCVSDGPSVRDTAGKKERKKKQKQKQERKKRQHCQRRALHTALHLHFPLISIVIPGLQVSGLRCAWCSICGARLLRCRPTQQPWAGREAWSAATGSWRWDKSPTPRSTAAVSRHPTAGQGSSRPVGASGSSQPGPPSEPSKELEALPRAQSVPAAIRPIRRPRVVDLGLDSRANLPTT